MKRQPRVLVLLVLLLCCRAQASAAPQWDTPESRARWQALKEAAFEPKARFEPRSPSVILEVADTAQDAAIVPVTVLTAPGTPVSGLDLFVDENPSPMAARIAFGPAGDGRKFSLRVRVNAFTNVHAVVHAAGALLVSAAFVQGTGGCSTPVGTSDAEASAAIGDMRMRFDRDPSLSDAPRAVLMIRHPNFNGMQTNASKDGMIPARYIKSVEVDQGGRLVFRMSADISLSTNPVLGFLYKDEQGDAFTATVVDSTGASWTRQFRRDAISDER